MPPQPLATEETPLTAIASPPLPTPVASSPQDLVALRFVGQGKGALAQGDLDQAREQFQRAVAVAPLQPYSYYFLGRVAFALVANTDPYSYAGGRPLHIAPEARFELGLDLVAPKQVRAAAIPRLVRFIVRGEGQQHADDIVYAHDLDRFELRCDEPLPLQVDGEDLGDVETVVFEAERDAVSILAPAVGRFRS